MPERNKNENILLKDTKVLIYLAYSMTIFKLTGCEQRIC